MKVITVTELNAAVKSLLEPAFRSVQVKGEISNFKLQSSGHLYFSLKDSASQVSAVLFRGNAASLQRLPKEGDQVVATGELSIYAPRGNYQLVIRELQFLGMGELLFKLHELKNALAAKGWFEQARKKALPKCPKRIGVVTSPTGAVIRDILHVLTRRFQGFQVLLHPVKVQGTGAAEEIAEAIYDFNRHHLADVLIVGRGGGSIEDLWAFNEEIVAKAIFESQIPIISAVGHETDVTIADFVADVRAPTPSAAAEIAIAEKTNLLKFLAQAETVLTQRILQQSRSLRQRLQAIQRHPLIDRPERLIQESLQKLDHMREALDFKIRYILEQKKERINTSSKLLKQLKPSQLISQLRTRLLPYSERLVQSIQAQVRNKRERLMRIEQHLRAIHPKNLLRKGYSILFYEQEIVASTAHLSHGKSVEILLFDGIAKAQIEKVTHDTGNSLF